MLHVLHLVDDVEVVPLVPLVDDHVAGAGVGGKQVLEDCGYFVLLLPGDHTLPLQLTHLSDKVSNV